MIIVKIINQRVVQVALAPHSPGCQILATRNQKNLLLAARTLAQSTSQSQKVTNVNHNQLIPIARNISFRQCRKNEQRSTRETSAKASFSISASSPTSAFISADLNDVIVAGHRDHQSESPFEVLKRKARDVVEKREWAGKKAYYGQSFNEAVANPSERKLVVLMSWLQAQEKHIEKYRQFYLERGFDVLNVKTSPLDLLLPNIGARKISEDFVRFMIEKEYSNVVLHGFSVGGYMFGRLLLEIDKHDKEVRDKMLESVRGIVFDSLVPIEGVCIGVANSVTQNQVGVKIIQSLLRLYLFLGHNIATKYFLEASHKVWGGPLRCPTLFLNAQDDVISDHKIVKRLASDWSNMGIECRQVLVDSAPHVQIFQKHQKAYVENVERLLKHIKMY